MVSEETETCPGEGGGSSFGGGSAGIREAGSDSGSGIW